MYDFEFKKQPVKFLNNLREKDKERIVDFFEALKILKILLKKKERKTQRL